MAWVRARLCKLQKGCTRLAVASDKAYQLLAFGRWFSPATPATPATSTTKTGRHDIAEILLKVASNTINQSINHSRARIHIYRILSRYLTIESTDSFTTLYWASFTTVLITYRCAPIIILLWCVTEILSFRKAPHIVVYILMLICCK
jgi:hypothetical protein